MRIGPEFVEFGPLLLAALYLDTQNFKGTRKRFIVTPP